MTDELPRDPSARPDPTDVRWLAELDAGLPEPAEAARRRAAAATDPDATAVLEALAATRAELAALPTPDVPPAVADRWAAALAAERDRGGQPRRRPGPASRDRVETTGGRGRRWGGGPRRLLAAAVAAALAAAGIGLLAGPEPAPAVSRVELVALGRAAVGTTDVGELADPVRRDACLRAVAPAAAGERLLGGRRVVLDGRPGVLLVLSTGTVGGLRLVTVDPACGPAGGTLHAQLVVG